MKQRRLIKYTAAAAALLLVVCFFVLGGTGSLNLISMPFTLAAKLLRTLSLSGTAGNIAAIVLFLLVGLLPVLFMVKRKWQTEDILLPLCSMAIWYALYYLINPALRPGTLGGSIGEFILAGTVYSVLICWAVIRLMNHCASADTPAIYGALKIFLLICAFERAFGIFLRFSGFLSACRTVASTNTMPGLDLTPTYIFLFFSFAVAAVEYALDAFVLYLGAKLVSQLRLDPYSAESAAAADKISHWCRRALVIITINNMALNLAQVLFASHIHSLAAQFQLPVLSIAIVFALLVLTSLLSKGRAIKEDNDLFI